MQFEIKSTENETIVLRAKDLADALTRFGLENYTLVEASDFQGWVAVWVEEKQVCSIRNFNRMKFRRD